MAEPKTKKCLIEDCQYKFIQNDIRGRKRLFCCPQHKWKYYRQESKKKSREYDFLKLQRNKLIQLLPPQQKKIAKEWGLTK